MLRLRTVAQRVVAVPGRAPCRLLGSHAHAHGDAHSDHHGHGDLSPAAAQYQATHATLFGEHTAPGTQRVREEWESWNWLLLGGTALVLLFGSTRPNTNPHDWARDEAAERLRRKAAGEEVLFGVHYAGIRYMRERGVVSSDEAAELEGGLVIEPPAPTQLRRHYPNLSTKPLFPAAAGEKQ